jgi:hypothetical protein
VRNVTISLDDETARWARIEAARADKSLSRFIADLLDRERGGDAAFEAAKRAYLDDTTRWSFPVPRPTSREDLYDRPVLRR